MRTQTSHFLIGSFVLGGSALFVMALILLSARTPTRDVVQVETMFDESVAGLEPGAAVRIRGVKVGEVDYVSLASVLYDTQQSGVVVRFHVTPLPEARYGAARLREIIERRVEQGMRVRLASSGLTGLTYLDTNFFPDTERYPVKSRDWIKAGEADPYVYIPSIPSQLTRLADSLEALLGNASRADLAALVNDLGTTVRTINKTLEQADVGGLRGEALATLRHADGLMQQLEHDLPPLLSNVDRAAGRLDALLAGDVDAILANLKQASTQAQPVMTAVEQTVGDARVLLGQGQAALAGCGRDLNEIFDNLRAASDHLRNLLATSDRYPSFLLFGNPPSEIRTTR